MKQEKVVWFAAGAALGLIVGLLIPSLFGGASQPAAPSQPISAVNTPPPRPELDGEIAQLKALLEGDPKNYDAWVKLGNDYFDTNQYAKSADAYQRALALNGSSPDVRTDLGIMYRALGRPQDALAQFRQAMTLDPKHFNSRLNTGVVLLNDLQDVSGAIRAWEELLAALPNDQRADQVRRDLEGLRQMAAKQGGGGAPASSIPVAPGVPALPPGVAPAGQ